MSPAFEVDFVIECCIKIVASIFCGFVLGVERKSRNQVVGARTLILIAVSSALLSILSYYMAEQGNRRGYTGGDPTRIVAGVVSGIGFLGGGAIIRQGLNIKGITSAAIIWTASALGLSLGVGLYVQSAVVLAVAVITLTLLEKIEGKWLPTRWSKTVHLMYSSDNVDTVQIEKILEESGMIVSDVNVSRLIDRKQIVLHFSVKTPRDKDFSGLIEKLRAEGELSEFTITD